MNRLDAQLIVAALSVFLVPASANAQLSLSIDGDYLAIDNMTPSGSVAVMGVVHDFPGITVHVSSPLFLGTDSDGDGSATIALDEPISPCSIISAVDLTTGSSVVVSPQDTRIHEFDCDQDVALTSFSNFSDSELEIGGHLVTVMVVRPGAGVWRAQVGDGGPFDADGTPNGKILLLAESLARDDDPIPPPAEFLSGDTVVVIEMLTRKVTMGVLDEGLNSEFTGTN